MNKLFTFLIATSFMLNVSVAQNVGEVAPDFTLTDIDNQSYKLSDNQGKVILVFLVGYNCSLCISSAPTVKSEIINVFGSNSNFQAIVIDTWDGTTSGVNSFKNTTGLDATYLQDGSNVASDWGTTYDRLVVIDQEGKIAYKGSRAAKSDVDDAKAVIENALNITTSIDNINESNGFSLGQNYPNPVQNQTKIQFNIGEASDVTLSVYNIVGEKVFVPIQQYYLPGSYEVLIQSNKLSRGAYFYRLEAGKYSAMKKMIVQ